MRRMFLILAVMFGVMVGGAPLASANPYPAPDPRPTPTTQFNEGWQRVYRCTPEFTGQRFSWDDNRRGRGHWDYTLRNGTRVHLWWETRYCATRSSVSPNSRDRDRDRARDLSRGWDSRDQGEFRRGWDGGDNRDRGDDRDRNRRDSDGRNILRDTDRSIDRISAESIREQVRER